MFVYLHIFFTYSIYINTHLQPKASEVKIFFIEKDILIGCLQSRDIFNRIKINSNCNCCLFVCLYKYCLFVCLHISYQ